MGARSPALSSSSGSCLPLRPSPHTPLWGGPADAPAAGVASTSPCVRLRVPASTRGDPASCPAPAGPSSSYGPGAENPCRPAHSAAMEVPGSLCKKVKLSNNAQNWVSGARGGWEPLQLVPEPLPASRLPPPLHPP